MSIPVIEANSLTRRFGSIVALDHVDLSVGAGERIALVGHNGAGKSTLIKLVLGLLPPDEGRLSVLGGAAGNRRARAACAYLPENLAFHGALTGREQLAHFARLKSWTGDIELILDRVGLADAMDRRVSTYSKGMRQRLGLAQLLLGQPQLVILDEPTTGLDPVSRYRFYEIVSELAANGAAVIQSSHVLTELEAQTDRIMILRNGRVAAEGDLPALRREANLPMRFRIRPSKGRSEAIRTSIGGDPVNGNMVELEVSLSQKMNRIRAIGEHADEIDDIDIVQPSLEDLYRHYSGVDASEGEGR